MVANITISTGTDYGDTGKGAQNTRLVLDLIHLSGVRGLPEYLSAVMDDPLRYLAEGSVVFNYAPFGGANAGNHIYTEAGTKVKTHLLPPGAVLAPYVISMLGMRKNVSVDGLAAEVEEARAAGADIVYGRNLFIDRFATLTTNQDIAIDSAIAGKLMGTKKGNAPAMMGRAMRLDPRAGDLGYLDHPEVRDRIVQGVEMKNWILRGLEKDTYSPDEIIDTLHRWEQILGDGTVQNGERMMAAAQANPNAHIFINATQGQCLDGDTGTIGYNLAYGVEPADILKGSYLATDETGRTWVLIKKAYVTRAGSGVMPGEFQGEIADYLRELGGEIGVTSGNQRRIGPDNWADVLYQADRIGGEANISQAIAKIDVMSQFMATAGPQRPIIGYRDGKGNDLNHVSFPFEDDAEAVMGDEYFWEDLNNERITQMIDEGWDAFPEGLRDYLIKTAQFTTVPVSAVGLGPKVGQTATRGVFEETSGVTV